MNQINDTVVQFDDSIVQVSQPALVFFDEADYEFVGGGASVINGS